MLAIPILLFRSGLSCYLLFIQCKVDKLVFIDVAESSTKGGSTDLEIFSLPKVEVSRGTSRWVTSDVSLIRRERTGTVLV